MCETSVELLVNMLLFQICPETFKGKGELASLRGWEDPGKNPGSGFASRKPSLAELLSSTRLLPPACSTALPWSSNYWGASGILVIALPEMSLEKCCRLGCHVGLLFDFGFDSAKETAGKREVGMDCQTGE